jgi:2-oxoglutarate ferredoxin oxidoreductase subunit delta
MKNGLIAVHSGSMQTSNLKYFAGGDAVNGGATVVEAVRMGKAAAEGIRAYLEPSLAVPEDTTSSMTFPHAFDLVPQMTYHQGSASLTVNRDWCKGCNICVVDCPAGILTLDDNELVYVTDIDHCILCGICALRCPDFVFSLATSDGEVMVGPGGDTLRADDGLKGKTGGHQYATSARK